MTNGEAWGRAEAVFVRDGWLHVTFFGEGIDVRVKVETVSGVPEITALHIESAQFSRTGPTVITSALYHRAPLSRLKALALDLRPRKFHAGDPSAWEDPPRGPARLSKERLKETERVYNQAVERGEPTLPALMDRFGIKESTARKYIGRVRDNGVELVAPRGRRPRPRTPSSIT